MNNEITCFVPLVIFIPEEQSYLNLAAELAINRHNLLQDNMSDNYVTVNFHKINHRDPRSWSNSIKNGEWLCLVSMIVVVFSFK